MRVSHNSETEVHHLPGLEHQTLAGGRDGMQQFEIWRQTIDAGAATPVHRHDCEEVIVIFEGEGVCRVGDVEHHFKADDSLLIPPNVVHQIVNTGSGDLRIMATLSMAPVRVETETGEPMPLPWDAPSA
ncbi:MAG: cupin domain-containing protein [Gammaproteobacteria bacterium]